MREVGSGGGGGGHLEGSSTRWTHTCDTHAAREHHGEAFDPLDPADTPETLAVFGLMLVGCVHLWVHVSICVLFASCVRGFSPPAIPPPMTHPLTFDTWAGWVTAHLLLAFGRVHFRRLLFPPSSVLVSCMQFVRLYRRARDSEHVAGDHPDHSCETNAECVFWTLWYPPPKRKWEWVGNHPQHCWRWTSCLISVIPSYAGTAQGSSGTTQRFSGTMQELRTDSQEAHKQFCAGISANIADVYHGGAQQETQIQCSKCNYAQIFRNYSGTIQLCVRDYCCGRFDCLGASRPPCRHINRPDDITSRPCAACTGPLTSPHDRVYSAQGHCLSFQPCARCTVPRVFPRDPMHPKPGRLYLPTALCTLPTADGIFQGPVPSAQGQ